MWPLNHESASPDLSSQDSRAKDTSFSQANGNLHTNADSASFRGAMAGTSYEKALNLVFYPI
jgi:hypothetical protein